MLSEIYVIFFLYFAETDDDFSSDSSTDEDVKKEKAEKKAKKAEQNDKGKDKESNRSVITHIFCLMNKINVLVLGQVPLLEMVKENYQQIMLDHRTRNQKLKHLFQITYQELGILITHHSF